MLVCVYQCIDSIVCVNVLNAHRSTADYERVYECQVCACECVCECALRLVSVQVVLRWYVCAVCKYECMCVTCLSVRVLHTCV